MRKKIGSAIIIVLVFVLVFAGGHYLYKRSKNAISDAAFIKSDTLAILSFNVGGKVVAMYKKENDPVRSGELLALIDPIDLETAQKESKYRIESIIAEKNALQLQRDRLQVSLDLQTQSAKRDFDVASDEAKSLTYQIESAKARYQKTALDEQRYEAMLKKQLIAQSEYESIHTQMISAEKEVESLQSRLSALNANREKAEKGVSISEQNRKQIPELDQKIASLEAQQHSMEASLDDLIHKTGYTKLYSPFDGVVAKKFTESPAVVKQGSPIYAVADPNNLYGEVLLSERQLHGVKVGNNVTLEVDAVPGKEYHGKVESISPTSASTFSLVPRDIASGEFTKLDQRFTVRIKLDSKEELRAGMGMTVVIERS